MLRIIDANLDRVGEGLRVLEEIARFILEDIDLTERLKRLRHELVAESRSLEPQLLSARQASGDVAAFMEAPDGGHRQDIIGLVRANARRVQESLRVLEEFAKLPSLSSSLSWAKFQEARFAVYELEQKLASRLLRQDRARGLAGLHVILDVQSLRKRDPVEVSRQVVGGGAKVVQLRDKQGTSAKLWKTAQEVKSVCIEHGVFFIINDYLDLALAVEADGLHLGQKDLPVAEVRRLLPIDKLIGCSVSTLAEAQQAWRDGADYLGVGAIYPTSSKDDFRLAGLAVLRQIKQTVSLPAVAIGGINETNVAEVMEAGADGVAVISAVLDAVDIAAATRRLAVRISQNKSSG